MVNPNHGGWVLKLQVLVVEGAVLFNLAQWVLMLFRDRNGQHCLA
jgi:hypothetical protein